MGVSALSSSSSPPPKVAVIGGGACGLAAARALVRQGIRPLVLEKSTSVGGVWRYSPSNTQKENPMYRGLRTNLPKEIMAFREYSFAQAHVATPFSYVTHQDVLQYLQAYQRHFQLPVHYQAKVTKLSLSSTLTSVLSQPEEAWPKLELEWEQTDTVQNDVFDAVLVCNGHYDQPSIPHIPGLQQYFTGNTLHSREYDNPSLYQDQVVLCIGGRASGSDLAREIRAHARQVILSDTTCTQRQSHDTNLIWVPETTHVDSQGNIHFKDQLEPLSVDTIIFCTGYDYSFPFLEEGLVQTGQRRVQPLLEQLWHARYPNLTFLGLPHSILPFPLFELQAQAIVAQWKQPTLPNLSTRLQAATRDAQSGGPKPGGRIEDTHYLGPFQWDYNRKMARYAGIYNDELENYISTNEAIYEHAGQERGSLFPGGPDTYRQTCYQRGGEKGFTVTATEMDNPVCRET